MSGYFGMLVGVCAIAAIAATVAPEGRLGKHIDLLLSLLILLVLLSPLGNLSEKLPALSLPNEEEVYPEASPIWEATEVALSEAICTEFGFARGWVLVSVTGEIVGEDAYIKQIEVILSASAREKTREVREYILSNVRGECEVVVYVG